MGSYLRKNKISLLKRYIFFIFAVSFANNVFSQNLKADSFTKGINTNELRNLIYVNDFIDILYKCLFIRAKGEIFNVGSCKNYKIKFVIDYIHKLIKKGLPKFGFIKLRKDEPLNLYPDLKKISKHIKLRNEITITEGLKKTISSIKKIEQ